MTTQTNYTCDGCGKEKRGIPHATQKHDFQDGSDAMPEDWSDLRLQDFGNPIRAYFRHYCPGCTKRMLEIINNPLLKAASEFDRRFDAGEDISNDVDWTKSQRPGQTP